MTVTKRNRTEPDNYAAVHRQRHHTSQVLHYTSLFLTEPNTYMTWRYTYMPYTHRTLCNCILLDPAYTEPYTTTHDHHVNLHHNTGPDTYFTRLDLNLHLPDSSRLSITLAEHYSTEDDHNYTAHYITGQHCALHLPYWTKCDETVHLLYSMLGDFARTWPDHDWPHHTITESHITIFDLT